MLGMLAPGQCMDLEWPGAPSQGGKSTLLRASCLAAIMAQVCSRSGSSSPSPSVGSIISSCGLLAGLPACPPSNAT